MKPEKHLILFLTLLLLIVACQQEKAPVISANYFPLEKGRFNEYLVTEIRHAINQAPVTSVYQLREVIGEAYTDASGTKVFPITRSRKSGTDRWEIDSIIPTWTTTDKAFRIENGHTIVKLKFPIETYQYWNGNEYNTLGERFFELRNVGKSFSSDFTDFENTVTVLQQNDSTLVSLKRNQEIFADQIGLIHRERTRLYYCSTNDCVGKGQILYGTKEIMQLVHSGKL